MEPITAAVASWVTGAGAVSGFISTMHTAYKKKKLINRSLLRELIVSIILSVFTSWVVYFICVDKLGQNMAIGLSGAGGFYGIDTLHKIKDLFEKK